jgi:hypothetical protein
VIHQHGSKKSRNGVCNCYSLASGFHSHHTD